jgi:hypothetical protein
MPSQPPAVARHRTRCPLRDGRRGRLQSETGGGSAQAHEDEDHDDVTGRDHEVDDGLNPDLAPVEGGEGQERMTASRIMPNATPPPTLSSG